MCGRYALSASPKELVALFGLANPISVVPRYNIAPNQNIPVVRNVSEEAGSKNTLSLLRWGLIPSWSKSVTRQKPLINARSETVDAKPSFKESYKHRRCLVPASGFYEWESGRPKKQPYYIGMTQWKTMAIAGIWDQWRSPTGEVIESCSILTTEANETLQPIHHRMPVILRPQDYATWLAVNPLELSSLLAPFPASQMQAVAVSTFVNSAQNEGPDCIRPAPIQQKLF